MASAGRVGDRMEVTPIADMSDCELKSRYIECQQRYRVAQQNFEFEYAQCCAKKWRTSQTS